VIEEQVHKDLTFGVIDGRRSAWRLLLLPFRCSIVFPQTFTASSSSVIHTGLAASELPILDIPFAPLRLLSFLCICFFFFFIPLSFFFERCYPTRFLASPSGSSRYRTMCRIVLREDSFARVPGTADVRVPAPCPCSKQSLIVRPLIFFVSARSTLDSPPFFRLMSPANKKEPGLGFSPPSQNKPSFRVPSFLLRTAFHPPPSQLQFLHS